MVKFFGSSWLICVPSPPALMMITTIQYFIPKKSKETFDPFHFKQNVRFTSEKLKIRICIIRYYGQSYWRKILPRKVIQTNHIEILHWRCFASRIRMRAALEEELFGPSVFPFGNWQQLCRSSSVVIDLRFAFTSSSFTFLATFTFVVCVDLKTGARTEIKEDFSPELCPLSGFILSRSESSRTRGLIRELG